MGGLKDVGRAYVFSQFPKRRQSSMLFHFEAKREAKFWKELFRNTRLAIPKQKALKGGKKSSLEVIPVFD